jgi:crotonobetainyl-CoA:carnitine CoA-transferase CaiB-like acyl-CoA transferase
LACFVTRGNRIHRVHQDFSPAGSHHNQISYPIMIPLAAEPTERRATGPLVGIRVLALEQMQALPFATQLLARLGADVVKIESPDGELGRASQPSIRDPNGKGLGATFLRNSLGKRSICIDLKDPRGRDLVLGMAKNFDVVAENFRAGTMEKLGLGFDDVVAIHPECVYASVSGFGSVTTSPYRNRAAFAPIVEAMSGIYEMKRVGDAPPSVSPVGALGDIGAALFAAVGILAALRERDRTGRAQHVDVAMFDSVIAMTDIVSNFWSMGLKNGDIGPVINHGFRAEDGWFIVQVGREHHFERLVDIIGRPDWVADPRFATREGWMDHLDSVLRPAIERWAQDKTRNQVCEVLAAAGIAAGPCLLDEELVADPHIAAHQMLIGIARPDGSETPVLVPGNPVRIHTAPGSSDTRVPWLGEHTDDILTAELRLPPSEVATLRRDGVVA